MPEFVCPVSKANDLRFAVIDFDGTLSLIRAGWLEIMVAQMIELLMPLPGTSESVDNLTQFVTDFVLNLNGRPTIYQMDYLVNEIQNRGGHPETAEFYKDRFLVALHETSERRIDALKAGQVTTDDLMVPGARMFLTDLKQRGIQMTLASGTAVKNVRHEAALLEIDHFFEGRIFGPDDDPREFSKLAVMRHVLTSADSNGSQLIGFGDGFVEIENIKQLGGIAVGCATDEEHRSGQVEQWKRKRLIQAGADVIVPDYRDWAALAKSLFS